MTTVTAEIVNTKSDRPRAYIGAGGRHVLFEIDDNEAFDRGIQHLLEANAGFTKSECVKAFVEALRLAQP